MTVRRGTIIAGIAVAAVIAVSLASTSRAEPARASASSRERPRGAVEDCSTTPGWGRRDEFTRRRNLVVGPLAVRDAAGTLGYVQGSDAIGNRLFVFVRGGHRVTLELTRAIRGRAGLGFGLAPNHGEVFLRDTRRVVAFVACRHGERSGRFDGWPVTAWVGSLLARSPMCVPLLVWVDDEPRPRRAIVRFGVRHCG